MTIRFGYLTFANQTEAEQMGAQLVDEGLIACMNIIGEIKSIYRWQDKIESSQECAAIVKTSVDAWASFEKRAKELHSYDTPCITGWDLTAGHPEFLDWISANTKPRSKT